MLRSTVCGALILLACAGPTMAQTKQDAADLKVIINAKIWTGNPQQPAAQTVVFKGDRIVQVGGKELGQQQFSTENIIDAGGRRVIPGLIDCHTHIVSGGLNLMRLQLREARDKQHFIQLVTQYAKQLAPGEWIVGRGWTVESWTSPQSPTRAWIDAVTLDKPALLTRMDGHQALANSKALELAGIRRDTPDPVGGRIARDPQSGELTGILKDAAIELVEQVIPEPVERQKNVGLRKAIEQFHRFGVTMVHDMSEAGDARLLSLFTRRLRIYPFLTSNDWPSTIGQMQMRRDPAQIMYKGLKGYMDGSLGSRTAYMREPYLDNEPHDPDNRGLLTAFAARSEPQDLLSMFRAAAQAHLQPAVHAIGDQANHLLLNAYEELAREFPGVRPRIEHAQHLLPEDISRFKQLGVIPSMQPLHKMDDGRYAAKRIGEKRCQSSYAFKSLLDSGAVVCFGSDWPVVSNNPLLGIEAAVTAQTLDGESFIPEQRITVDQALRCYTSHAAYACFMEDELGMIKPGYLADMVILNQDILEIAPDKIGEAEVDITMLGGRIVWQRN